jgi:5'-nucleotidase/UDP-sugar diphosphatase
MAKNYVVKANDTLRKIAQELLGDAERWAEIYEANRDKVKDPNVIQVGQELTIPTAPQPPKRPARSGHQE